MDLSIKLKAQQENDYSDISLVKKHETFGSEDNKFFIAGPSSHNQNSSVKYDVTEVRKRKVAPVDEKQSSYDTNDELNTDLSTNLIYKNGEKRTKRFSIIEHINDFNSKRCTDNVCFKLNKAFSGHENIVEETSLAQHGHFGSVTEFQDINTKVIMKRKKITGKLEPNEVVVPLLYFKEESHLAQIYGLILDKAGFAYILMENAGYALKDLHPRLFENYRNDNNIEYIMLQVLKGLQYLAGNGITHCDIKPENICVKSFQYHNYYEVKIIDFGSCVTKQDNRLVNGVTTEYLPPELVSIFCEQQKLHSSLFNGSIDVWSAGMVTLYLAKGKMHPTIYFALGNLSKYTDSMRKEVSKMISSMKEPLDPYFTTGKETLDHLLSHVLKIDPELRWKASDAVSFLTYKISRNQIENG